MLRRLSTSTRSDRAVAFSLIRWNIFSIMRLWCPQFFSHRFSSFSCGKNHTQQGFSQDTHTLSPSTLRNISISPNTPPGCRCSRMVRSPR